MNLYDRNHKIHHFASPLEILEYYYDERVRFYKLRKDYIIGELNSQLITLNAKIKFILEFITGKLKISNISKTEIITQLEQRSYPKLGIDENFGKYEYLIKMPIYNLTKDKIDDFTETLEGKNSNLEFLNKSNNRSLWQADLNDLEELLIKTDYNKKKKIFKKIVKKTS